jgi:hypothetical protein
MFPPTLADAYGFANFGYVARAPDVLLLRYYADVLLLRYYTPMP